MVSHAYRRGMVPKVKSTEELKVAVMKLHNQGMQLMELSQSVKACGAELQQALKDRKARQLRFKKEKETRKKKEEGAAKKAKAAEEKRAAAKAKAVASAAQVIVRPNVACVFEKGLEYSVTLAELTEDQVSGP